jgi:hypothetical protein
VFGGWTGTRALNTVYTFDTSHVTQDSKWRQCTFLKQALFDHSAVAIDTHQSILVCGGSKNYFWGSVQADCRAYAPAPVNKWTMVAALNTARFGHGMAVWKGRLKKIHLKQVQLLRWRIRVQWSEWKQYGSRFGRNAACVRYGQLAHTVVIDVRG